MTLLHINISRLCSLSTKHPTCRTRAGVQKNVLLREPQRTATRIFTRLFALFAVMEVDGRRVLTEKVGRKTGSIQRAAPLVYLLPV